VEVQTVIKSQLEDDPCVEEKNSLDDYFIPSLNKKPSPFAASKTMFELEADKVKSCAPYRNNLNVMVMQWSFYSSEVTK